MPGLRKERESESQKNSEAEGFTRSIPRALAMVMVMLIVAFVITAGAHYVIYSRIFLPIFGSQSGLTEAVVISLWCILFFGFAMLRFLPMGLRKYYEAVMFTWMGLGLFLIMALVPVLLISAILSFDVSALHIAGFSMTLAIVLSFVGFKQASVDRVIETNLKIVKESYFFKNSEPQFDGVLTLKPALNPEIKPVVRAVVLSDVHVSGLLGAKRLKRILDQVNALQPDLIFVVGDLVDGSVRQLARDVAVLKSMKASSGVYFVTGNHEYFSGAAAWKTYLATELGWNILENSHALLEVKGVRLTLLGIEDRQSLYSLQFGRRADTRLSQAVQGLVPETFHESLCLLLAHQPKDASQMRDFRGIDLQISGHTHAGQIWPFSYVVRHDQKYLAGLYELGLGQKLYVSQGACFWGLPFRLGTRCEISLLNFLPA